MSHVLDTRTAVTPPPSLEDILGAADRARIGRVDFTHRLVAEAPPQVPPEPEPVPEPEPEPVVEPEPEPEPDLEPAAAVEVPPSEVPHDPLESVLAHLPRLTHAPEPAPHVPVEEVARTAAERIHAAREATLAHLAAVEEEVARRCELVTAQAELDAELIRLQARREAHAILAAARARVGELPGTDEGTRLAAIADVVGRLTQDLDADGPGGTR